MATDNESKGKDTQENRGVIISPMINIIKKLMAKS